MNLLCLSARLARTSLLAPEGWVVATAAAGPRWRTSSYPVYSRRDLRMRCELCQMAPLLPVTCQTPIHSRQFVTKGGQNDPKPDQDDSLPVEKMTLFQRFKQMYKQYWYVLVPVHCFTSVIWFGTFYYVAKTGFDIVPVLEYIGLPDKFVDPIRDSAAGHLAVMFALYKLATPARYIVTLGGTTVSIKYLRDWGYIKPIPSKEKLKEMYEERKENLKDLYGERKENLKERYQERKEELKEAYRERKEEIKQRVKGKDGT